MDIVHIIQSIQKLKAGLAALIDEDNTMIKKTKELYYSNSIIYDDTDDEIKYKRTNCFYDFLKQDQ